MEKILIAFALSMFMRHAIAQEIKPVQKSISVGGSSEIEVVPDEIYVQVDLREYNKKNGDKVNINTIKNNFLEACKSIGLTDKDVTVPAVNYPTLGYKSVMAHSVTTGPGGNIVAGSIYGPCCRSYISAVNEAFTGGQNARKYRTITQQDISTVTNDLPQLKTLIQRILADLET